jgi:antitoxin HicB
MPRASRSAGNTCDVLRSFISCPSLPGVVTEGETVKEALAMAKDAIAGYLESLRKDGLPIPEERGALMSPLTVALPEVA